MSLKFRKDLNRRLTVEEVDANFEFVGVSKSYGQTNIVKLDRLAGDAGDWDNPITGDLVIDLGSEETGDLAVNNGCFVVIWSGSSNPKISGAPLNYIAGNITVQGTYSIYFHYLHGRVNVNIYGAQGVGELPGIPAPPTNLQLTVGDIADPIPAAPTNLVLTEGSMDDPTPAAPTNLVLTEGTF